MTLFLMDVMDLKVFDEKGKFITKLDKATEGKLVHNSYGDSLFAIKIVDFDIELTKALGEVVTTDNVSDFEKELTVKSTKIKFKPIHNDVNDKKFKLIAEGELHNADGKVSHDFKVIINKAKLVSGLDLDVSNTDVSNYTHVFQILADVHGDSFELEIFDK